MNRTALPGLYVHTPFCKTKCPYCDFYSVTKTARIGEWVGAVLREASRHRDAFPLFDSLYIGGGTPSVMNHDEIEGLLEGLSDIFHFDDTTELTMELNPDDVTKEKLAFYRSLGVNRISLGVQSFNEQEVRFLGRRHTARQAQAAVSLVAQGGFAEFGLDLMYGLPRQSTRTWLQTLRKALSFGPAHLSCYQLTIEGDTPFSRLSRGGNLQLPGEARQGALFLETSNYLTGAGFIHYEISNFAHAGKECLHNLNYWRGGEYIGLGAAAASHVNLKRYKNSADLESYINSPTGIVTESEVLEPAYKLCEEAMLRLRLVQEGVDIRYLQLKYGCISVASLLERLNRLVEEKLLTRIDSVYRLHSNRVMIANRVFTEVLV